jgi:exodeoxyribonuclease-5
MEERKLLGDQPKAYEAIQMFLRLDGGGFHLLQGYAGTGKTYLLDEIVNCIQKSKCKVIVTAPTHKAVKVLKNMIKNDVTFSTIHAALGMRQIINNDGTVSFKPDHSLGFPADDYTHIIVDEVSMINDIIFETLIPLTENGKKIIMVGDPLQIPPIGQREALPFNKNIRLRYGIETSYLNSIIRQALGNPIIENATNIRTRIHAPVQIFNSQEVKNDLGGVFPIKKVDEINYFTNNILPLFKSSSYERSIDYIKVIAWTNDTVDDYNKRIREYIFGKNLPNIIPGDKLIADKPIIENNHTLISTNEEMEVLSTEIKTESLNAEYSIKYYYTKVRIFEDYMYNEYMLRIIHEDSEETFNKLCTLQKVLANSYTPGSYKFKSAWVDYYNFLQNWHQVKYSYAITAHKSQGSTYENAYVLKWDIETNYNIYERNRILYTACTRPSKNLFVVY